MWSRTLLSFCFSYQNSVGDKCHWLLRSERNVCIQLTVWSYVRTMGRTTTPKQTVMSCRDIDTHTVVVGGMKWLTRGQWSFCCGMFYAILQQCTDERCCTSTAAGEMEGEKSISFAQKSFSAFPPSCSCCSDWVSAHVVELEKPSHLAPQTPCSPPF